MQNIATHIVFSAVLGVCFLIGCVCCAGDDPPGSGAAKDAKPKLSDAARAKQLTAAMEKLRPLHKKLGKPQPGDWLLSHPEQGQTFREYLQCGPVLPRGTRHVVYVQPIGDFTATQRKIVDLTVDFMGRYFSLPVKVSKDLPLSLVPPRARRTNHYTGQPQILTGYVLDDVLKPRLPADAAAFLALTASDLWPGEGWNFVFGQASLTDRVGVWSINRNGDPNASDADFRLCLLRTIKTAVHETGHMFSMLHCTAYECCMCGSNNRAESDRRPLALCPECMAKVCWATQSDPVERLGKLVEFCRAQGLKEEAEFYEKESEAMKE